ncbi:hypothetical protein K438DRAFT_1842165 [Mycena galopus ATCC 62051]|nr:hypothetical protein K438DRAFT_1842165 [Mycena galopus ATCC 62051]
MSLELNSVLRLECRPGDVQDLKDAIAQFPADDPYAATARALLTAYTTVELAKKEANKLKVQITTLNDLLAQEGGRAKDLQAKVYAVIKEKNVALSAREADERKIQTLKDSLAHEQARADALQGAADEAKAAGERDMQTMKETHSREMDTLRTSSAQDRDAYQQMQNWIVGRCSAFEAERNAARQGIFEIIRQQLDQIPHFLPPDPISAATQSTPAPSAGQKHPTSGNVSVAPKRPRTESNPKSTNQPDTSVAKRPRMDSSPTRTIACL